jgi:ribosomal protein S18 acetylase RimI-like enzyme
LRPGLSPGGSVYPGDDAVDSRHFGAFSHSGLVAVASICRELPRTRLPDGGAGGWRLRGMATAAEWRGRGLGERLATACIAYARSQGAALVWCSARERAQAFYGRLGFQKVSDPYHLPHHSDHHYVEMHLVLQSSADFVPQEQSP